MTSSIQNTGILLFGPPGAGKNGVGELLKLYGIQHLVTGDLFRSIAEKAQGGDPIAMKVYDIMKGGRLVDDTMTMDVLRMELGNVEMGKSFIFDAPRSPAQVEIFCDEDAKARGLNRVVSIYLNASRDDCRDRLNDSNERAKRAGRPDNDPNVVERRLDEYESYSGPTIKMMKRRTRFIEINGGVSRMEVHATVLSELILLEHPHNGYHDRMSGLLKRIDSAHREQAATT